MVSRLWAALLSALPALALLSGPDHCIVHDSSSSLHESSLLRSLRCHNDYKSYVHCRWREHTRTGLQLWFKIEDNNSEQCQPYGEEEQNESDFRTVECRYNTLAFSVAIKHTVFFFKNNSVCSSAPQEPLGLSRHLRARTPVNLSTRDAGDGGRQISWSSPYLSSSSLNERITYQVSYRTDRQDDWTTEDVTNTSISLERRLLIPGHRYEARVRARASVGQWSDWSPVVTWEIEDDAGHFPSVHCVLDGEKEVMCSWEVSRRVAHFITYQLACRENQTAPSARCCANPTVTSDLSGTVLKYSCKLTVADPEHLLLELLPSHAAKTFKPSRHIRPNPPQQVKVREKGSSWRVEWMDSSTASEFTQSYQACYYKIREQGCSVFLNSTPGSMFVTILAASLVPSQSYRVKVRSLVCPRDMYRGIPSEWTDPVDWTSHEASWSLESLIYISISVFVTAVFFTLYCTIPACQRRVVLWVNSVPSPGKSKILSEIMSATTMQSENTFICKGQNFEIVSTCSSVASLWQTKDTEENFFKQDNGCWSCDSLAVPAETANSCDSSSMSFSGPYIFCQSPELHMKLKEKAVEEETPSEDAVSPSPLNFTLYREDYVCLPSRNVSQSVQNLVSQSEGRTNTHGHDSPDQEQQNPDQTEANPGLSEPSDSLHPPPYTSVTFTSWPHGGAVQASGYCHIPSPHCGPGPVGFS